MFRSSVAISVYNKHLTISHLQFSACALPPFHTTKLDPDIPWNAGHKSGVADRLADIFGPRPARSDAKLEIYQRFMTSSLLLTAVASVVNVRICRSLRKKGKDEGKVKLIVLMINTYPR